jgi:pyruvate, orthophosphate dikinase
VETTETRRTTTGEARRGAEAGGGARWLRRFEEGSAEERALLGGKGANLAEMTRMGLPVPPGFTITTDACRAYLAGDGTLPDGLLDEVRAAIADLETRTGLRFGDPTAPLLVSVRSGAAFSMPGMMDTVLNLGLSAPGRAGLAARVADAHFAEDAYRRLLELFARVVLGIDDEVLADAAAPVLQAAGVRDAGDLDEDALRELVDRLEHAIEETHGAPFPEDAWTQLELAIAAVFRSWNGRRARDYRRLEGIPDDLGTAVNVQIMVFGNAGQDSGTGVAFTRDPATGAATPVGDFLLDAQGEDVVAGTRNTLPLAHLRDHLPGCADELDEVMRRLEERYRDLCDLEFTIEHGTLYVLQTRVGKRTAAASLRTAVEMAQEGLIDRATAVLRFRPEELERLLHPRFDPDADVEVAARGLGASPGAASGRAVFTADEAERRAAAGDDVILVRTNTSPEDLHGIVAARGVLTSRGGLVSHAAVVARGIGRPAVCGVEALVVGRDGDGAELGGQPLREGDVVSIDGTTGQVVLGAVPVLQPEPPEDLERLLGWADELRRLGVLANADTPEDARAARGLGAEGIGLCRTEHQFLGDRLPLVQRVILADTDDEVAEGLQALGEVQRSDFTALLEVMDGLPVTVRLLDPPLHEFLPSLDELLVADARGELDARGHRFLEAALAWREVDPMLGVRGVRLGLLKPGLYETQVRALIDAAVTRRRAGGDPRVRIMVPLVVTAPELQAALDIVRATADEVLSAADVTLDYEVGAMVETPRAALLAGELAALVDFLSFGTNDLTQLTFGFSRDDVEARLMPLYLERGILDADPFQTLDTSGVGALVRMAVGAAHDGGRHVDCGVCGEHGGDPASIAAFHDIGLDDVSCSPHRVPVARLAAAHAALGEDHARDR